MIRPPPALIKFCETVHELTLKRAVLFLEIINIMRPVKHFEKGLTYVAKGVFNAIRSVNQFKPNPSFTPKWSDKPLLKSWQKIQADAWLSAHDRFALSELRDRGA